MSSQKKYHLNSYDFLVDCDAIDESDILNFHKCLMVNNNIK